MKTGLVLEGGALRTIYSAGVTDGFLELGIDFDYVVGVSAGIAYGVSYIAKQFGRNLEIVTRFANDSRYMSFRNMVRPGNRRCYFGLHFTYGEIPQKHIPFDQETYLRWPGTAEAVVTDITTGKPVYLPIDITEPETPVLQATCAMPLLFPIFNLNGLKCMDGGASDSVPWKRALDQGCDRVVVVLTREREYRKSRESLQRVMELAYRKYPAFVDVLCRRAEDYNRNREELFAAEKKGLVRIFSPESTVGFSRTERDVDKIRRLWEQGRTHAHARADEIRSYLSEP